MEATPTERTERENQLDQSNGDQIRVTRVKPKRLSKRFRHVFVKRTTSWQWTDHWKSDWGEGERGGGKKINANQIA